MQRCLQNLVSYNNYDNKAHVKWQMLILLNEKAEYLKELVNAPEIDYYKIVDEVETICNV